MLRCSLHQHLLHHESGELFVQRRPARKKRGDFTKNGAGFTDSGRLVLLYQ